MDNKLAENMLRFGVKNLSEASKLKLMSEQAAVPLKPNTATPAQLVMDYDLIKDPSWAIIQKNTANHGTTSGKVNGKMTWEYPAKSGVTPGYPLYDANGKLDATKVAAYNKQYNIVLQQALADPTWCNMVISQINTPQWTPSQIINFQTQIANNITNTALVASNGNGGPFNDGKYAVVTLRAFAIYQMQLWNNENSRYLIAKNLV